MATLSTARPSAVTNTRIPWYLWCAALAVTSVTIGAHWDVSWHRSIGRDTFWTPAHMAIYALRHSRRHLLRLSHSDHHLPAGRRSWSHPQSASSVSAAPLGAFLAAWGGVAMLTSAPFDNWWHNAYGLDVKIVSPAAHRAHARHLGR